MTDKKTEALKLALEALRKAHPISNSDKDLYKHSDALTAIREALADEALDRMAENARELGLDYEPAQQEPYIAFNADIVGYVAPQRTWVGLTDQEFQWIYDNGRTPAGMIEMAEAKLKEKNT